MQYATTRETGPCRRQGLSVELATTRVDIGACVHPDHRAGAAIALLWDGIARFMRERSLRYLIGCASLGIRDGGANAIRVYDHVVARHLAPVEYRVRPRNALIPPDRDRSGPHDAPPLLPPLLEDYLRLGAWIGGEPSWDPDFNTADLFLLMPLERIEARNARRDLDLAA